MRTGAGTGGISGALAFDKKGILFGGVTLGDGLDVAAQLARLGVTLPIDVSGILSISAPSFQMTTSRTDRADLDLPGACCYGVGLMLMY